MFDKFVTAKSEGEQHQQATQMLAGWLNGGYKVKKFARNDPYASGSIIPGSNYSAQDNHNSLEIPGL
eukprot:CAMPEP_0184288218 /NCGR_PEP_ID=MMETSP1049-20130417/721_1 /TAXON_ID=77928 /ORGANISM="Proteomonas sulcata, Strain CCMP704" /LENGTH=66 /DNA_ID=CAMNT_0026594475 /DNA_START=109 /DNA_END=309 /DNA_ORIENTATION=-